MMETKQVERQAEAGGPKWGSPAPHRARWPVGEALADQAGLPADAAPLKLQPGPPLPARKIAKTALHHSRSRSSMRLVAAPQAV